MNDNTNANTQAQEPEYSVDVCVTIQPTLVTTTCPVCNEPVEVMHSWFKQCCGPRHKWPGSTILCHNCQAKLTVSNTITEVYIKDD